MTPRVIKGCLLVTGILHTLFRFINRSVSFYKAVIICLYLSVWVLASDSKVWIGLYMEAGSPTVEWTDGSPLTLTSWQQKQPSPRLEDKRMCVAANRKVRSTGKGQKVIVTSLLNNKITMT